VYQAAMFDPLTAAMLTLDQIVELCDELIAAHGFEKDGGYLPNLDTKKSLVPTSGKKFSSVDPKSLRASWDKAQQGHDEEVIKDWHIIGPFKSDKPKTISLDHPTPLDEDITRASDGSVDLKSTYRMNGSVLKWTPAKAQKRGLVNLTAALGAVEYAIAYGYAEIDSVHARDAVLRIGSDDGIRIWLNGKQVHSHEVGRGYAPCSDQVAVHLKAGKNRLVVKIDNNTAGWGFGVQIPRANF
jgi:hypothetical protein